MAKKSWKPGNMLYPLPAVMVSCADREGKANIVTVAWAGTVCTNPPMVSISLRPSRYSHGIITRTREFVINLTTEKLAYAADLCGVVSGRDVDKFKKANLTALPSEEVKCPAIAESPVNIECRVKSVKHLGSHDMFIAEVVNVRVDDAYLDEKGSFDLSKAKPMAYSHGKYYSLGREIGHFGYSVRKKGASARRHEEKDRKKA